MTTANRREEDAAEIPKVTRVTDDNITGKVFKSPAMLSSTKRETTAPKRKRRPNRGPPPPVELRLWPGTTGESYTYDPREHDPKVKQLTNKLPPLAELFFPDVLVSLVGFVEEELIKMELAESSGDISGGCPGSVSLGKTRCSPDDPDCRDEPTPRQSGGEEAGNPPE